MDQELIKCFPAHWHGLFIVLEFISKTFSTEKFIYAIANDVYFPSQDMNLLMP